LVLDGETRNQKIFIVIVVSDAFGPQPLGWLPSETKKTREKFFFC